MAKKYWKKILGLKVFLVINLLLLIFFSFNLFKEYNRNRQLNKEIKDLELMASELEAKNLDILDMVKYLDTDEFLEEEARLKLGLKKQGETVAIAEIPDFSDNGYMESKKKDDLPNYYKWFEYFFGKKL